MSEELEREEAEGATGQGTEEEQHGEEKTTDEERKDIEEHKAIAAVAYLIFFLPLLASPDSQYGRFHANQALLLLITVLGINTIGSIIPIIGWFLILPLGFIFTLVLFIIGIINAAYGKKERLPLIGGFDIIK